MAYKGRVGGGTYMAQKSRNGIAVVRVVRMGRGNKWMMILAHTQKGKEYLVYAKLLHSVTFRLSVRSRAVAHARPALSIHPSIHLFMYLSIYLSIYCIYLSLYPSIHPSIHPSIYLSICLSVHLCIDLSIYPSIYPSIYLSS